MQPLHSIKVKNFRSLAEADIEFSSLSVLIGPNGSGKSNLLKTLSFVRDTARFDISQAIGQFGGFERLLRQVDGADCLEVTLEGTITQNAAKSALDSYTLRLATEGGKLARRESFTYKRVKGRGKRYTITSAGQEVGVKAGKDEERSALRLASSDVSALGALARVDNEDIGQGPSEFFAFLSEVRYLDPVVRDARMPARMARSTLADDASNLAAALFNLREQDPDAFSELVEDLRRCLPGLDAIDFQLLGGDSTRVGVRLCERGLRRPVDLADASFGTVRVLALFVALHEPNPPRLTVIEEVDHGLHPYALDVLVDRLRAASQRSQIVVASHSPTLVNRLEPKEIIICDRDPDTGESLIPAISAEEIAQAVRGGGWRAGELWFTGMLGGVPR